MTPAEKAYAQATEELHDMEVIARRASLVERMTEAYWYSPYIKTKTIDKTCMARALDIALEEAAQVADEREQLETLGIADAIRKLKG